MTIDDAQAEVRAAFMNGSVGQFVSGAIWLVSAALSTFIGQPQGILALVLGGMLIFPLTQLTLKLMGKRGALSRENPLGSMPLQSVFAMVAMYPLIYAASRYNVNWFYPAFMIVVGAHYLWFIVLYGMWQYGVLATALVGSGIALGVLVPNLFSVGGWVAGIILVFFAAIMGRKRAEERLEGRVEG